MTKTNDFLFEILTEELPPKALLKLENALTQSVINDVKKASLNFSSYKSFSTPRRLSLLIRDLEEQQPERIIERRGPSLKAAYDEKCQPTKAALGFARSCSIDLKQANTLKTDKGEWLYYKTTEAGKTAAQLLPSIIEHALKKLPVPKLMTWGHGDFSFVRPIHNLLMIYGDQVIHAEILGHKTNNQTTGHRFHQPDIITIKNPASYPDELAKAFVVADFSERKRMIEEEIQTLAQSKNATAIMPKGLLEEVASLVEWPVPLLGKFDTSFLTVPKEALMLAMETHQKYFPLINNKNELLPFFITISNIESKQKATVIHGNERVMRARLADAQFFYETDKKTSLETHLEKLSHVIFQKQLGSLRDKTERVTILAKNIAAKIKADVDLTQRAATLAKTDLVTNMVGEFPELQGIMGRYYAEHDNENKAVAIALDEAYMPRFSGDQLPQTPIGQALAIAERIDTLVGIFGIGKAPTGDKDPFALRRAALGVLRIIIECQLDLDLATLIDLAITTYGNKLTNENTAQSCLKFCEDRLKNWAEQQGIRPDVFAAVAAKQITKPLDFKYRLDAVNNFLKLSEASSLAAANKRVSNILNKQNEKTEPSTLNEKLLTEPAEKNLAICLNEKAKAIHTLNYQETLTELADLKEPIDDFFDHVMVMTDDEKIRQNRVALLTQLRGLFLQVADISLLQQP